MLQAVTQSTDNDKAGNVTVMKKILRLIKNLPL